MAKLLQDESPIDNLPNEDPDAGKANISQVNQELISDKLKN
jgi:hypothetical protein